MRIAVIGAGAVGGVLAAVLSVSGHEVTVTARGAQLAAIRARGIHLSGGWGSHTVRPAAVPALTEAPELAFLCVKAQDTAAAISGNPVLAGVPIVVVQNGLDGLDEVARLLPDSERIGALAMFAASYLTPGEVAVTTPAPVYLGCGPGEPPALARLVVGLIEPIRGIPLANFTGAQWTKLVVNHVNAMPAITGLSVQETIADRRLRRLIALSMREAIRVGIGQGVTFGEMQGLSDRLLRLMVRLPARSTELLPLLLARRMGSTPNPGSTLQSIRRGQRTEIDFLNGAVLRRGLVAGVPTPVSACIVHLVHEVEDSGSFISPAEVAARAERYLG